MLSGPNGAIPEGLGSGLSLRTSENSPYETVWKMPQRTPYRVSWWHQVSGSGLICFHLPAFEASIRRQFRFSRQFQRDCPKSLVVGQARTLQVQKRDENNLILVLCASQLCDQDATQHLFGQSQRDCPSSTRLMYKEAQAPEGASVWRMLPS